MLTLCPTKKQIQLLGSQPSVQMREMGVPKSAVYAGIRRLVTTSMS